MKIDALLSHSIYCVYPPWMVNMLKRNRERFNRIVIYKSDHLREKSYETYLKENIQETWVETKIDWFTDPPPDWRQEEATAMLPYIESDWIYFTEQDFFVKDYNIFYDKVQEEMAKGADVIGWWSDTGVFPYFHPSSFFIKRETLEKTQKDFRAHPEIPGSDHFATISRDLEKLGVKMVTYKDMGLVEWEDYFHLGGLTQNYIDTIVNPILDFHRPEIFHVYNYWSRQARISMPKDYLDLSSNVEALLKERHPEAVSDPLTSQWAAFFK